VVDGCRESRDAKGQRQLGLVYLEGAIAVQDFREARKWLELAADEGDEIALRNLGDMSENGLGAAADPVLAYAYYSAAAIRGSDYGTVMRDKIVTSLSTAQQREGEEKAQAILARITGNAAKHDSPAAAKPPKSGASNDS
jgi:TPR repeat protein